MSQEELTVRSYTLKSTAIMTLIDLFFNCVMIYVLGSLLRVLPEYSEAYWTAATVLYLLKTALWLGLRIPLMLPIDRWERRGAPPDDDDPKLVRAIYYFPFDFTLFYGILLGVFYAALVAWMIYGWGPIQLGRDMMMPGLVFASAICAGGVAIGVPVNLMLTARLSRRLGERHALAFSDIPGKNLSLGVKMATIALALGCAPSLLLFSVQTFVQDQGLYQEAQRTADAIISGLASEDPDKFARWALTGRTHPFWLEDGRLKFAGRTAPPPEGVAWVERLIEAPKPLSLSHRQFRFVLRVGLVDGRRFGVLVRVPDPENHWFALSLVVFLASIWPILTATLLVRTIVVPIAQISSIFHRIIGRGRTEETDRVPIYFKDEVGRLAFNANRTIDILTEARSMLEVNAQSLAQKNAELEQAYRTKGEFLANMSHELRTPLNAIIGFSRLMRRKLEGTLPPRQQKNLSLIEQSGEQLLTLVNDLLDFEKIEAGKLVISFDSLEMKPFFETMLVTLKPTAEAKSLNLNFSTQDCPDVFWTDRDRLRQILTNLVTNAIKYSDGGEVRLETAVEAEHIVFTITDQGIGMDEAQLARIFDPFHQVDSSETRERGGVGLGLAIVARLVRLLRGDIKVESSQGEGSKFTVRLPLERSCSHLLPEGTGPAVLVIDDNLEYLESIHAELSGAGYRVTVASSGEDALEILSSLIPRVILLDIVMPSMDGWEVLRRIRALPALSSVPVVVTSAVDDRPVGLDVDFAGRLSKPFEFEEIKRFLTSGDATGEMGQRGLMVVEDDAQTRHLLEQVLEENGLRPAFCSTEQEAKDRLNTSLPSVLILDLNLEEGSGWSVLTHLRGLPGSETTRVFIYTASDLDENQLTRLKNGVATLITKHGQDSLARLVTSITS